MYQQIECEELIPCPWCGDQPVLCDDGLGRIWVECVNLALPSDSGRTCPVCPVARSDKETLRLPAPRWTRAEAIAKWNGMAGLGARHGARHGEGKDGEVREC
jgi:hypothetical protein